MTQGAEPCGRPEPHEGFREFFAAYEPRVRKFVRWCGLERCHEDDVVQMTMQEAFTYFPKVRGLDKPECYLFKVAQQRWARLAADQRKHGRCTPPDDLPQLPFREAGYAAIEERDSPVFAALAQLCAEQREAVVLRAFGTTYQEIAELQGIEVTSARARVSRAHAKLRTLLSDEEGEGG